MSGDSNDIPYNNYSIDLLYWFDRIVLETEWGQTLADWFHTFTVLWQIYTVLAFFISAILLIGLIYALMRLSQFMEAESAFIAQLEADYRTVYGAQTKNARWEDITRHLNSDNPNDWKLAIIEADVMLQELLESRGYPGNTVGEKLKSASPKSFQTLDAAWSAHKVRNQVAHSGTDFVLTKRVAQETITQYKMVLQEFGVL